MNKQISILLTLVLLLCALAPAVSAEDSLMQSGLSDVTKLTEEQIRALMKTEPDPEIYFESTPSTQGPDYAPGKLSQEALSQALWTLNFSRRLAGLTQVSLNEEKVQDAQYGAVLLSANGALNHHPVKPADMEQSFYERGYDVTSSSNIYWGSWFDYDILSSAVNGFMDDSDTNNISRVGHRRWQLNPSMSETAFGCASDDSGTYITEYAMDRNANHNNYDFISWPASGHFPDVLFSGGTAWSVSLNPESYQIPKQKDLLITVESQNHTWILPGNAEYAPSVTGRYVNVETSGYGIPNCIIFRPENVERYQGTYQVKIEGLKDISGMDTTLCYQVHFFDPYLPSDPDESTPSPEEELTLVPFQDVDPEAWYYACISYVFQNKLMSGHDSTHFGPSERLTRGQLAQILYNKTGRQESSFIKTFDDVIEGQWFAPAVTWAADKEYICGYGDGKFGPEDPVTREQIAAILWRYAQKPDSQQDVSYFSDAGEISQYAKTAICWAVENKIMSGKGDGLLDPTGYATRAEVSQMMMCYIENIEN